MSKMRVSTRVRVLRAGEAYEWDAGKIPENNHEAPFLVEHIPSLRYAFLSFSTACDC